MIIEKQPLENVLLLKPKIINDKRGYFFESYRDSVFKQNNLNIEFVQRIRNEKKFPTVDGLKHQLTIDRIAALNILD